MLKEFAREIWQIPSRMCWSREPQMGNNFCDSGRSRRSLRAGDMLYIPSGPIAGREAGTRRRVSGRCQKAKGVMWRRRHDVVARRMARFKADCGVRAAVPSRNIRLSHDNSEPHEPRTNFPPAPALPLAQALATFAIWRQPFRTRHSTHSPRTRLSLFCTHQRGTEE